MKLSIFTVAASCAAVSAVTIDVIYEKSQSDKDVKSMAKCFTSMTSEPDWYDYSCENVDWIANTRGWQSAPECYNLCEGRIWESIALGYNAAKCFAHANVGGIQCWVGYCNRNAGITVSDPTTAPLETGSADSGICLGLFGCCFLHTEKHLRISPG